MAMLKLISVNIERSKHLDRVIPFLKQEDADVVCLQEVMEYDLPRFESALGMKSTFVGTTRLSGEGTPGVVGIGMLSRLPIRSQAIHHYAGTPGVIIDSDPTSVATRHETENRAVLAYDVENAGERYRIATTHFTWTPDGAPNDFQRADMQGLLRILDGLEGFVLCGDFNAPRGGEMFALLASRYADNIPLEYTSSIDGLLHRAGPLPVMVDGLFTTPDYIASDVRLVSGVSDHCAIVATIRVTS